MYNSHKKTQSKDFEHFCMKFPDQQVQISKLYYYLKSSFYKNTVVSSTVVFEMI